MLLHREDAHKELRSPPQAGHAGPLPAAGDPGLRVASHLDVSVLGTRGHKLAVGVEVQAADVGFVSHERAKN